MRTTTIPLGDTDNGEIFKIFVTPQNNAETQSLVLNDVNDPNVMMRNSYVSLQIDVLKASGLAVTVLGNLKDNSGVIVIAK